MMPPILKESLASFSVETRPEALITPGLVMAFTGKSFTGIASAVLAGFFSLAFPLHAAKPAATMTDINISRIRRKFFI